MSFQGELDAIARLELTPHGTWELGCFYTEELIQSNSERPHFERILIVVDRTTKYALMAEILSEKDTDMELIQKLLQLFKKIKLLPKNLMVPTNALATLLEPVARSLPFTVKLARDLRVLTEFLNTFPTKVVSDPFLTINHAVIIVRSIVIKNRSNNKSQMIQWR